LFWIIYKARYEPSAAIIESREQPITGVEEVPIGLRIRRVAECHYDEEFRKEFAEICLRVKSLMYVGRTTIERGNHLYTEIRKAQ